MPIKVQNKALLNSDFGTVFYGKKEIYYRIYRCKRKTLEIAVLPNCTVEIRAPIESPQEVIDMKVKKRAAWIVRQQVYFKQFNPRTPERQYLGGETHLYLGKRYRLKVVNAECISVSFVHGYIKILHTGIPTPEKVRILLRGWYREKALVLFNEIFRRLIDQFHISKADQPKLQIREMKTRWGSLSRAGLLTLNIDLIRAPKECIEYVLVHELCHIQFHNHSKWFYKLLENRMPDWKKRKMKLEEWLI